MFDRKNVKDNNDKVKSPKEEVEQKIAIKKSQLTSLSLQQMYLENQYRQQQQAPGVAGGVNRENSNTTVNLSERLESNKANILTLHNELNVLEEELAQINSHANVGLRKK